MCRAPVVAVHQVQQLASRAIVGHGVRRRPQAVEAVATVGVRDKLASQVVLLLLVVLLLVQAIGGRLPDIDNSTGQGQACVGTGDLAVHQGHNTVRGGIKSNGCAVGAGWCIVAPEGAQNGGGRERLVGLDGLGVGDGVDQTLKTNDVAHELALVAGLVGHLARGIDHLDAHHPLVDGQVDLTSKVVDVLDEVGHNLAHTRRRLGAHAFDDAGREVLAKDSALSGRGSGTILGGAVGGVAIATVC